MMQEVIADIFNKAVGGPEKDVHRPGHKQAEPRQRDKYYHQLPLCCKPPQPKRRGQQRHHGNQIFSNKNRQRDKFPQPSGVALIRENKERFKFSSITSRRKVIKREPIQATR